MKRLLLLAALAATVFVSSASALTTTLIVNPSAPVAGGTVSFTGGRIANNQTTYIDLWCTDATGTQLPKQTQLAAGNVFTLRVDAVSCFGVEYSVKANGNQTLITQSPLFAVSPQ